MRRLVGLVASALGIVVVAVPLAPPVAAAPGGGTPAPAAAAAPSAPTAGMLATDRLIVHTSDGSAPDAAALGDDAGTTVHTLRHMDDGGWVVELPRREPAAEVASIASDWTARPDVARAEPDAVMHPLAVPNDPQYTNQWHYGPPVAGSYGANLPGAWDVTTGASNVVVSVIDTGKRDHADLAGRFLPGYDFITDSQIANDGGGRDSDATDPGDWITSAENSSGYFAGCGAGNSSWHGTHVSGTIAANTNNALGVAGINWVSKIVPARVLGKCGGYTSDIVDAIRWSAGLSVSGVPANANKADVINMSLGGSGACSATYQNAINDAVAAGTVVVVAAGNSNVDASTQTPSSCANVSAVAATGKTGNRAYYSNYGTSVEIAAPGGDSQIGGTILSTLNAGTTTPGADSYAYYQGTSMATPHVVGVVSLIRSIAKQATPAQVLSLLQSNVTPFPAGSTCTTSLCGTGILNAAAAVSAAARLPGAPATPTATASSGQATVSWTAPAANGGLPVNGYTVTPYVGGVAQTPLQYDTSTTTRTITGLTNGTTYTFTVAAKNMVGTGTASPASNAVTPATTPGAPAAPSATGGDGQAVVTWSAPASTGGSPITGYTVTPYIGAVAQAARAFDATSTSRTITGLTNGTTYDFTVTATNGVGAGPQSPHSPTVTPATTPAAPTDVTASGGNGQATVSWTAPPGTGGAPITGYRITPSVGGIAQPAQDFDASATARTITGLTNGTTYTFTVAAVNGVGPGPASAASNAVTPATTPGTPTGVTATPGNGQATVSWTAPADDGGSPITGYRITPILSGSPQAPVDFDAGATSRTVSGLTNGASYAFTVTAVNAVGDGAASDPSEATTPVTTPGAPTGVTATAGGTQATVSWTAPADDGGSPVTGYHVTPIRDGAPQAPVDFDATTTTRTIADLAAGASYTFTVTATNAVGDSPASSPSAAVTLGTAPGAPTTVTAVAGNHKATVSWTAPASDGGSSITGYTVTPYKGATPGTPVAFDASTTSRTVTGLANTTAYTFRVAATNTVGTGPQSAASAAVTPIWAGFASGPFPSVAGSAPTTQTGFTPVPGRMSGDTFGDLLWYGPTTTEVVWTGSATATFAAAPSLQQTAALTPLAGDFNGDGATDIFWYGPGTAVDQYWLGLPSGGFSAQLAKQVSGTYIPVVGDVNGDGFDDIFWYGPGSAFESIWTGSAAGTFGGLPTGSIGGSYTPVGGDFNGDGKDDVFFYAPGVTNEVMWQSTGTGAFTSVATRNASGTYIPVAGDFDGEGADDIFWYAPGSGTESVWNGSPTGFVGGTSRAVNNTYTPVVVDVNGDGNDDIYWYAPGSAYDSLFLGAP